MMMRAAVMVTRWNRGKHAEEEMEMKYLSRGVANACREADGGGTGDL